MKSKDFGLAVFVNGRPVHEYEHKGNTFIEGRKSSPFEIEFRNHTSGRVLVVPSVDGVSTLNGQRADADSPGYVVKAHDILRIKGWTVDNGNVAQFVFKDKDGSYGRHAIGSPTQAGVVGVLVYKEKVETRTPPPVFVIQPLPISPPGAPYKPWVSPMFTPHHDPYLTGTPYFGGYGTGVCGGPTLSTTSKRDMLNTMGITANNVMSAVPTSNTDGILGSQPFNGDRRVQMSMTSNVSGSLSHTASSTPFELGTGWGDKVEMKTNQVTFNREDTSEAISLYYDSRRNLEKRGIEVLRREPRVSDELPQAFAGVGCKPPPGWNG